MKVIVFTCREAKCHARHAFPSICLCTLQIELAEETVHTHPPHGQCLDLQADLVGESLRASQLCDFCDHNGLASCNERHGDAAPLSGTKLSKRVHFIRCQMGKECAPCPTESMNIGWSRILTALEWSLFNKYLSNKSNDGMLNNTCEW